MTDQGNPKLLGQGNFGKTYEAVRSDSVAGNVIEERVALKVLNPDIFKSESKRVQFVREHTALARLKHANLVHSIKCGEDDGEVYFAMELCMGGDLAGLVNRFGALPEWVAAKIGLQVAAGLREMHRREMIHRDIKPPNVMIFESLPSGCTLDVLVRMLEENESLCRIVDFGLVGAIFNDSGGNSPVVAQKFVGSMMYASPEQILERKDIDGRTDIYALGMTLWYLLQGRGPLLDQRSEELKHVSEAEKRHLSSEEHKNDLPASLSKEFASILARMVAKRPEERFANAKDLATALERYLEKSVRVRSLALTPAQSREALSSFYGFKGEALKSISHRRFIAENRSTKQMGRLTIVEDLDNLQKIRSDFHEVVKKVFARANTLRQPGTPVTLLPVQDVIWSADALAYTEDLPGETTLAEVLQARTASRRPFSFREAEVIFRPIATALDYLINQGWEFISLPCEEVWLSDSALSESPRDKMLQCRPLDQWEDLAISFSGMWVPPEKDKEQGIDALYASISDSASSSSIVKADSLRPPVSAFLRLVYRTLSGSDVPDAADRWPNGYISSVALQSASNNLIRDLLCKQIEWSSVTLILNELCANEGVSVNAASSSRVKRSGSSISGSSALRSSTGSAVSGTSLGSVNASRHPSRSDSSSSYLPQQPAPPAASTIVKDARSKLQFAPWMILTSVGSLIAAIGILAYWWSSRPASWVINVEPVGSTVTLAGKTLSAPAVFSDLKAGTYTAILSADGYEQRTLPVDLKAGKSISASPVALVRSSGKLILTSSPPGASYRIAPTSGNTDEVLVGTTPVFLTLPVGNYEGTLEHAGQEKVARFSISRNSTFEKSVDFPPPSPVPVVASAPTQQLSLPTPTPASAPLIAQDMPPASSLENTPPAMIPVVTNPAAVPPVSASTAGLGSVPQDVPPAPKTENAPPATIPTFTNPAAAPSVTASTGGPGVAAGPGMGGVPPASASANSVGTLNSLAMASSASLTGVMTEPVEGYWSLESMFADSPFAGYSESGRAYVLFKAQEKMGKGGFYKSKVDGKPGKGTHTAIKAYQSANNLPPSGCLDGATISSMGLNEIEDKSSWQIASTSRPKSTGKKSNSGDYTPESEKTIFRKKIEGIIKQDIRNLNPFRSR